MFSVAYIWVTKPFYMKRICIPVLCILVLASLASCRKYDYTCVCEYHKFTSSHTTPTIIKVTLYERRKNATAACKKEAKNLLRGYCYLE